MIKAIDNNQRTNYINLNDSIVDWWSVIIQLYVDI